MTVQEVMERVGTKQTGLALAFINDGLQEIAERTPDKVKRAFYSIEADTRFYLLPTDMIKLQGVYRKYDSNGRYIPISMISDVEIQEDSSASTVTTDDDIIII